MFELSAGGATYKKRYHKIVNLKKKEEKNLNLSKIEEKKDTEHNEIKTHIEENKEENKDNEENKDKEENHRITYTKRYSRKKTFNA